jgi:hypothetical protein
LGDDSASSHCSSSRSREWRHFRRRRTTGTNGQITFGRFNPTLGDTQVYVVNPDGSGERLSRGNGHVGEFPRWFSDGAHIATCCPMPGGGSRIINPDDERFVTSTGSTRALQPVRAPVARRGAASL